MFIALDTLVPCWMVVMALCVPCVGQLQSADSERLHGSHRLVSARQKSQERLWLRFAKHA